MEIEEFTNTIVPMRTELKNMALRLSGDSDMAEDLVQEVMLRLWCVRSSLDRHTGHKALAVTILKNKYRDYWRHRQLELPERNGNRNVAVEYDIMDAKDEVALIKTIAEGLPPLQAMIFRMKDIEGYDKEDIMKVSGCSPDSLRQNLSRARRYIREEFIRLMGRKK